MNAQMIRGRLKSGQDVMDRHQSHLHLGVIHWLPRALLQISLPFGEQFAIREVNLGRVVGNCTRVLTGPDDRIVYAKRLGRRGHTRFVLDRDCEATTKMTIILKLDEDTWDYVLISAWFGTKAEPEPWDRNATVASAEFWARNALVWGSEPIVEGTETDVYPW